MDFLKIDPATISAAVAGIIVGIATAFQLWVKRGEKPRLRETEEQRLVRIVQEVVRAEMRNGKPPRLSASERRLRDRAIKALHRDKFDPDDIARVLNITERVARKVLAA